ncbi:MAG: preprotein translocase subunit SecA [Patescibacteria group bacterium]
MSFLTKLFGGESDPARAYALLVAQINVLEPSFQKLSNEELKGKTVDFKARLTAGATLDDLLPEAFAAVREAARRTLGQRHYDVQLIGGAILHKGNIAEMKTGEGKTLVATLPVYLNALMGEGVHVITVNDYLSRRDGVWMGQVYEALGLSLGIINHETSYLYDPAHNLPDGKAGELDSERDTAGSFKVVHEFLRPVSRREAYAADITYGTNNEFGFDYLRDNLAQTKERVVQRLEHNFAIVDEVDSILIDEARTPLIISAPVAESESLYVTFTQIAAQLEPEVDYEVDEKTRQVAVKESGIEKAEKLMGIDNFYTEGGVKYAFHLETALRAKAHYLCDREYVVKGGEVIIVDEFTGRLQPGRRWSEGLHQAVEAKEGVRVREESKTFASITFQNYFKLYKKLSGMTGTALTSKEEFQKVYGIDTVLVPTHRPSARVDKNDLIFQTEAGKMKAVAREIKKIHDTGQPVLVGTVSIEKNELVSAHLKSAGVPHQILNAKNHEQEGAIIAEAGKKGGVVVATNMAGRGVDIKLGGPLATPEEAEEIKKLGGLFVLGTERHDARRIDNQLRGRAGRQGDPGTTQFFISLEDSLARIFASERIKSMMGRFGIPEDEAIENRLVTRAIESAQAKIEGLNLDSRRYLLEYDSVLNQHRMTIYARRRQILFGDDTAIEALITDAVANAKLNPEEQTDFDQKLTEKRQKFAGEFLPLVRRRALQVVDHLWVDHLESMDYLKQSVRLRAYGQRDPFIEYKKEGLAMFRALELHWARGLLGAIATLGDQQEMAQPRLQTTTQAINVITSKNQGRPDSANATPGRNDPCPCGSGKKFKKCHGA